MDPCEPVYESPLSSPGEEVDPNITQRTAFYVDEALSNNQSHVGYSYVKNTEYAIPPLSQSRPAYDNPVRATDGEYEESCRNSRVNENGVYDDIKPRAPNNARSFANCVQIFTLLLSILACIIGILALLVASGIVKLNDVRDETGVTTAQVIKLRNVSKQIGPRGFNGSQGLQGPHGPQGVGNMSACRVRERTHAGRIAKTQVDIGYVVVDYKQSKGWKVISAVCSTVQDAGALQTVLSRSGNTYTCTCVKPSIYSDFKALFTDSTRQSYSVKCKIIYWECPELT